LRSTSASIRRDTRRTAGDSGLDRNAIPERPVVVDLNIGRTRVKRAWLVLERGVEPSICIEDPGLSSDRYLFVEADVLALYPIARGLRDWWPDARLRLRRQARLTHLWVDEFQDVDSGRPSGCSPSQSGISSSLVMMISRSS
jgi:hypothetical protein